MNSGMYAALSGNITALQKLDVQANNLANLNTPGFKRDRLVFGNILASVNNPTQAGAPLTDTPVLATVTQATDHSSGSISQTGNTFDMALDGDGFFAVNTPNGKAYTRQGNFHQDSSGRLVTGDGYEVLGGGGPIVINGGRLDIDHEGKVLVDGQQVAVLDVVDFQKPYRLQKAASALFVQTPGDPPPQPARNTRVMQGSLENSNVNPILEMVQLIETSRYFESCSKAVKSYDDMTGKAMNEMGKV